MENVKLLKCVYENAEETKENLEGILKKCEGEELKQEIIKKISELDEVVTSCKKEYYTRSQLPKNEFDFSKLGPFLNSKTNILLSNTDNELADVILQNSIEKSVLLSSYLKDYSGDDISLKKVCEDLINIETDISSNFSKYI